MTAAAESTATAAGTGPGTPMGWRAAALCLLVGGFATGHRAARGRLGGFLVLGAGASVAAAVRIAIASRRPPIPPGAPPLDPAEAEPTFSVVVAARDEANVLPNLIADLGAQDYRSTRDRPKYELIVVDDRSSDGTAQVALRAAGDAGLGGVSRVVRRHGDVPDGKGAALTAVPPERCRGDVVVVLDADARIGPTFLSTLARYVMAGASAMTARRRIFGSDRSGLAGAQADEQTVDGEIQRGRWALGGCSEFRGNGIVVRRDLLAAVGGWRAQALTEDIDLSSRIAAARGVTVAWAIDAEVWEEPVTTWRDLWRQRVRWAEGGVRRIFEHGPAVLRSERLSPSARLDFGVYTAQFATPPLILGALAGALSSGRSRATAWFVGAYAAVTIGLGFDALRWETHADGSSLSTRERASRALRLAGFGVVWLAAVPAALWRLATRKGAVTYDKMAHVGGAASPETAEAAERRPQVAVGPGGP